MQQRFKKTTALFSLLVGVGLILGYIEGLVFPQGLAYGIKIGISNIVVIFTLMYFGYKQAVLVAVIKSVLSGLLFSSVTSIIYSTCGVLMSILVMSLLRKKFYPEKLSLIGLSIAGSAVFNVGQVIVACLLTGTYACLYLLVYMLPLSVVTGAIIGALTYFVLIRLKRGI